jgi:hypothetical protein
MVQVVEHLPNKDEALSSNSSTAQKINKGNISGWGKKEEGGPCEGVDSTMQH